MRPDMIAAVIVTFNPPGNVAENIKSIASEVDQIVIVDNKSDVAVCQALEIVRSEMQGKLECIWNDANKGLAAALNQGIRRALEKGAEWVLLLDHDSRPMPGMVKTMLQAWQSAPAPEKIALIAPNIRDENTTTATRYLISQGKFGFRRAVLDQPVLRNALTVITSGSLIKASAFKDAGLMPESFFIDCIDHYFCLRLKQTGFDILIVRDAILRHRLGEKTTHRLAGATVTVSNHSSLRRFTIFRNRIWMIRLYGKEFPGFALHDVLASLFDIFRILTYEDDKANKLKAVGKGIIAGFGRMTERNKQ